MLTAAGPVRITRARWLKAQEHEQAFWQQLGDEIAAGTSTQLDWYKWRANELESLLGQVPNASVRTGRVLEVGSGPIGLVNFLEWGDRYAIDPLEPFFRELPELIKLRKGGAIYLTGSGERLPLADSSVALIILDNVIDQTYSPDKILEEIYRVLQPGGQLYVCVNVHTGLGAVLHDVLAVLRIDKRHPHTFTGRTLRRLLGSHGFMVVFEQIEDYGQVKAVNRQSFRVTDRVKSYTGLSEFQHELLCQKDVPPAH
jgi:SAM-dependent methyltransferase